MKRRSRLHAFSHALLLALLPAILSAAEPAPQRPLPVASQRPLKTGKTHRYVDAAKGSDAAAGTEVAPWKTLRHAFKQLKSGDVLVLRGGVYHEHNTLAIRGTAEQQITLRSHPGELAILDGGVAEFLNAPATSWEPVQGGAAGEYRSTMPVSKSADSEDPAEDEGDGEGGGEAHTNALGNFAANMVPLHGYRFLNDLRSANNYFTELEGKNVAEGSGVYCGPGLFYDHATKRVHIRLAHTDQTCIGDDNYQGGTDPRLLPLVVTASHQPVLTLQDCSHVVVQDIVFRGSVRATFAVRDCDNITLDGITCYGGGAAMQVASTSGLRCVDSAFRGLAAPWTWRWSLKYRAIESRLVSAGGWQPLARRSRDFEFARCEFTDSVDGVFIGGVKDVSIHHCLLDNVSDDGFFVTCGTSPDGTTPGGNVRLTQNLISRVLTAFAFGVGHGRQKTTGPNDSKATGSGLLIARNVFDFRRPVHYQQPPRGETSIKTFGRFGGDHGSPAWEPMSIYHNTFLGAEAAFRGAYGLSVAQAMGKGTHREVANNIFLQFSGAMGEVLPEGKVDLRTDGNVHWSVEQGAGGADSFLRRYRSSPRFAENKFAEHDRYADPAFVSMSSDWQKPVDLRLQSSSPALGAGVAIDQALPDPLRGQGTQTDVGAIPHDVEPWRIGIHGRLDASGNPVAAPVAALTVAPFQHKATQPDAPSAPRAALVLGYPAFDAKLLQYALEAGNARVDVFDKHWLPVERFKDYRTVVFAGDLVRAKMEPHGVSDADIPALADWLRSGGTLVLTRGNARQVLNETAALQFMGGPKDSDRKTRVAFVPALLMKENSWVKPLDALPAWAGIKNAMPISMDRGENIVGDASGRSILARIPVDKGAILYFGWNVADYMPGGRKASTVEMEAAYETHYGIMQRLLLDALKE